MNESDIIKNRSEVLFLYDVTDANPNGDPDENKARIDEDIGVNYVTDVRLKRTIRDYLYNFKEMELFVRDRETKDRKAILDAKKTAKLFGNEKDGIRKSILEKCIDVRLFGATIPLEGVEGASKGDSITFTGPVQFNIGRSLHRVKEEHIKGTGGFSSHGTEQQKTFRDDYILPYSLICFYGIINENASKTTELTNGDVEHLLDGLWNGTKNLITRSKVGQMPRLLVKVNYRENNFHIGRLDKALSLIHKERDGRRIEDTEIRSTKDYILDVSELLQKLAKHKDKIESIEVAHQEDLELSGEFKIDGINVGFREW